MVVMHGFYAMHYASFLNKFALVSPKVFLSFGIAMASSQMTWKYDVFVSFRGKDTRNTFTDHLYGALNRKTILAFKDDKKLKKGEPIAPELLQALQSSRVFVVVFSKNYASSTWCLRELSQILDCVQVSGKHILPIFYDVEPSEVRKQSGNYEKAFAEYEQRFKDDEVKMVEVQRWRVALTEVADLSGWDVRNKPEYAEIEKIVEEIVSILTHKLSNPSNELVGMQSSIEELEKLLLLSLVDDVRVVGIHGMGGIGKTTLATVLYERISHQYNVRCYIDDVSKIYRDSGPIGLQVQFLRQALEDENLEIRNLSEGMHLTKTRLSHAKALVILDNVDLVEQLEKLAIYREDLGAGSRIIIISRDKHILKAHAVDALYNVQLLNDDQALQLFCRKAFKCDYIMANYEKMVKDALKHVGGLPLAIKVIGSFLFGRDVLQWRSALARLVENPSKDIIDVLRMSLVELEEMDKEIFLDIACFYNRHTEHYVKRMLDYRGFYPDIGIKVLIEKSLITISNGQIKMHDLLRKLGQKMVQENSTEEQIKWNRLWCYKDFYIVVSENKENKVEVLVLNGSKESETLMAEALSKMSNLRLLILHGMNISGSLRRLSNELRYLEWKRYPLKNLPSKFQPYQLVELILEHSLVNQLWKGGKNLPNLRNLNLRYSKYLIKLPDFRMIPNLRYLILEGCIKLVELEPSISLLRKLTVLNMKDCKSLLSIPNNILSLSSLEIFDLSGCTKVLNNQLSDILWHAKHMMELNICEISMGSQSTFSIFKTLIMLPFHLWYSRAYNYSASCLLPSLPSFSCLNILDLSFCNLSQIPDAVGCIQYLERLNLGGNKFVTLPSFKELSQLVYLNLQHCKQLKSLPELPSRTHFPFKREIIFNVQQPGLYIFDCPKLDERERCSSKSLSWMIQFLKYQAYQESSGSFRWIDIIIPGSEIPSWFNNQSVGSSISLDPSPVMHDDNWIGIAYCVVLMALDGPTTSRNERRPYIVIGSKKANKALCLNIPVLLDKDLVTTESDHMWLFYFTRNNFVDVNDIHDLVDFKMEIEIRNSQGLHLEVKNCGYHWIFKQDIELINSMIHRENLSCLNNNFLAAIDELQ
ncbi:TMV resistance protein N-like [Abrus precatorius]|uniref:ADP-ribosyl cyclase/cyclic ADP-ribose hydrolase n=1 Tax=Abrus precatorius TaxID=3816 RepID=A0A8B8KRT2_ABRPR|nr:TMV resistance protein N-like [Abrus precatorius]